MRDLAAKICSDIRVKALKSTVDTAREQVEQRITIDQWPKSVAIRGNELGRAIVERIYLEKRTEFQDLPRAGRRNGGFVRGNKQIAKIKRIAVLNLAACGVGKKPLPRGQTIVVELRIGK